MWIAAIGLAMAGKYDGLDPDVRGERVVPAPAEQVFAYLLDLNHLQAMFPPDCVGRWEIGERSFGEGANAIVRYDMAMMHRKLPMTLVRAVAPTYIDFDHVGPRGFVTRWTLEPAEGGTKVVVETPLTAPPPPLLGYYHNTVKPEWEGCYARALENLEKGLASK
ncbi:MAG: SRPBCC family protein [Myxococcota bacterium]